LRENSVAGNELADSVDLGDASHAGKLEIFTGASANPGLTLDGATESVTAFGLVSSREGFSVTEAYTGGIPGVPDALKASLTKISSGAGELLLYQDDNQLGIGLYGDLGTGLGSAMRLNQADGDLGLYLDGDAGGAGLIRIPGADGGTVIMLDGSDADGNGRVTTQVLEITGGSDLSESFEISGADDGPGPGMVVCIDANDPGRLTISNKSYDRTVAGIVSGAGGIRPGMLMGQTGTVAAGKHPVALTGRVYCHADASNGAIEPGDLLTTSNVPGHAMKATDPTRAQGAIIGKAMSPLREGRGLVLVLVSLQ
jgi:hypothetical protein